jgi:hypothetical protein
MDADRAGGRNAQSLLTDHLDHTTINEEFGAGSPDVRLVQ